MKRKKQILIVIGVLVVLLSFLRAIFFSDPEGHSEQRRCSNYCQTQYGLKGTLEQIVKNQRANPAGHKGPWNCICVR